MHGLEHTGDRAGQEVVQPYVGDPAGGQALRDALGTGPDGRPAGILGSEELLTIIENMPLSALATFSGLGVTDELIGRLVPRGRRTPR